MFICSYFSPLSWIGGRLLLLYLFVFVVHSFLIVFLLWLTLIYLLLLFFFCHVLHSVLLALGMVRRWFVFSLLFLEKVYS